LGHYDKIHRAGYDAKFPLETTDIVDDGGKYRIHISAECFTKQSEDHKCSVPEDWMLGTKDFETLVSPCEFLQDLENLVNREYGGLTINPCQCMQWRHSPKYLQFRVPR
jgi:hypothetical protein